MARPDPEQLVADVGRRIAELRQGREWTQEDLAHKLGMTPRHIQRLERGLNITLHTVAKIADALGVEPSDMLVTPASRTTHDSRPRRRGAQ